MNYLKNLSGGIELEEQNKSNETQPSMGTESSEKWYSKRWFTVLMLFLLPPVGIILLWKFNHFGVPVRVILSIVFGLLFIGPFTGSDTDTKPASTQAFKGTQDNPAKPEAAAPPETAKTPPIQPAVNSSTTSEETTVPGSLGMTPEQFKDEFNRAAQELDFPYTIKKITVQDGSAQNIFQYMFTDRLGLTGSVNKKDGTVRDVLLLGQGDGSLQSGVDIILAMGVLIESTNPELSPADRGKILKNIGILGDNVDVSNMEGSTIRNGIKYSINSSPQIGIMFSAGDANDNG